jgi:hypothetical protein
VTATTLEAAGQVWRYAPDDPQPTIAERSQVILQAQLTDEVLEAAPTQPLSVSTSVRGAIARAIEGGRVGVIGRPGLTYFAPAIFNGIADLSIRADGFLPLKLESTLGAQPGYPDAFAFRDLGLIALHRRPVRLTGRVVSRSAGALSLATVAITAVWPVLEQPAGPADAPDAMPLLSGLYSDRTTGSVRRRNFTPAPEGKTLTRPAVAGDKVIRLSDSVNISAGQVLGVEFGDAERLELIGITSVNSGSTPDQPAEFNLDHPLHRSHPQHAFAARAVPTGGVGPANLIARTARRGDATIWLSGLNGIAAGTSSIAISGGPDPDEFQPTTTYSVKSLSLGQYTLPPIHRVAAVQLTVSHSTQPAPIVRKVMLAWNSATQIEDFVFP